MDPYRIMRKSTSVFLAAILGAYAALALFWTVTVGLAAGLLLGACVVLPAAVLAWFILSLVLYLRAKKQGGDELLALKSRMRVATALLVFLIVLIALLVWFFAMAISHM